MGGRNENFDVPNKPIGVLRTRKAEIISGISVATLIALYGFARSIVSDIHGAMESQTRSFEQRIELVEKQLTTILDRDRERNNQDIQELKQRLMWVERERKVGRIAP